MERIYNPKLAGAAIRGTVTETSLCANRLALVTDGEGERQDSWHTQPVYYAGGGRGYSGQPEKGDDQYLYFPTMREENRYILGCVDAGEEKIAGLVEATADEKPEEEDFGGVSGQAVSPGISTTGLATSGVDAAEEKSKNLSKTKHWSTPDRRMLVLSETGVVLAEGSRNRLSVQNWGIRIKSNSDLNLTADEDLFANTGKISMEAGNYIWLQSGQSGMLLLPDQIQMSFPKIHLASPLNNIHPLKVRTDVEAVLAEYEKRKKSYPPLIASDGSVIRREGYDEILYTEDLWNYFFENVAGKDDRYPLKEDTPRPTLYEQWLNDTYGKTQMAQFWDYMSTVDGLQSALEVIGLVWPPADIANAVIYLCRGQYDKALWSAVFSIPALGDLLSIGKLGKFGKGLSFADWMSPEDAKKYLDFLENGSTAGLTRALDMRKADDVFKGGTDVWDMTEGGGIINGREYSQHAMERMAPDTPSVRAELSRRAEALAESKGLQVGTPEYYQFCQKYVDPRNIPPSVIEDAIRNTTAVPGHTAGTFVHQTADVTVIVNEAGKVITVIPK